MSETSQNITDELIASLFDKVKNWGRWGPDDERGTLNHLTGDARVHAAGLVQSGQLVSCARDFPVTPAPNNPTPALHHMVIGGDDLCAAGVPGMEVSIDFIGIMFHGLASTHVDALCHVFVDGKMYNGHAASDVRSTGARRNSIMAMKDGLFGRGVLLDVPGALGKAHVDPDHLVTVADLEQAERLGGVTVGPGDILLIYNGRDRRDAELEPADPDRTRLAGLHPECVEWFHRREISVLGSDAVHDPMPPGQFGDKWPIPVHMCGLAAMGLHLLHNLDLEPLAETCRAEDRYAFLFTMAPLRVQGGTGSPANPIAVF